MLTVKQIEAVKPKDRPYRLLDSNGLYLYVPVSGKKVWQMRDKIDGKEKVLTVGKYPLMSLQEARGKAWSARQEVSDGVDPIKAKKQAVTDNTFSSIYSEWYEHKKQVWSVSYASELYRMFGDDILPMIGSIEINEIDPMQILSVIRRFEERGAMERANKAMKGRRTHLVPMSRQVVDLLKLRQPITSPISTFVFAGHNDKKNPIIENAVLFVIRQIGYEGLASGHGFRHQFSTVMNENEWPHDAIERQLAHTDSGSIRDIYNHAQYIEKRREMMEWWADLIDGKSQG